MRVAQYLRDFRDCEEGSTSIELILVTPILVWVFLSTFVYFDVFRVETNAARAAITLAEMYSRETTPINAEYLTNTRQILRSLTYEEANPDFRVTVYRFRERDGAFRRVWSRHRGFGANLTNADLAKLSDAGRLPELAAADHNIILETRVDYDAPFSIGLGPIFPTDLDDVTFTNFIVIRPRPGRLCFDPDVNVADDDICGPT